MTTGSLLWPHGRLRDSMVRFNHSSLTPSVVAGKEGKSISAPRALTSHIVMKRRNCQRCRAWGDSCCSTFATMNGRNEQRLAPLNYCGRFIRSWGSSLNCLSAFGPSSFSCCLRGPWALYYEWGASLMCLKVRSSLELNTALAEVASRWLRQRWHPPFCPKSTAAEAKWGATLIRWGKKLNSDVEKINTWTETYL